MNDFDLMEEVFNSLEGLNKENTNPTFTYRLTEELEEDNMEYGIDRYTLIHKDCDGTVSTRDFTDKEVVGDVIKEFTYFLSGIGFVDESIEKYIPYFDV